MAPPERDLYVGNAGTAARFLTSVAAVAVPTNGRTRTVLRGNERMAQRPIGDLVDALVANGAHVLLSLSRSSVEKA